MSTMPTTRKFRETIWTRAQGDPRFRAAMLTEAINELLSGDGESHSPCGCIVYGIGKPMRMFLPA